MPQNKFVRAENLLCAANNMFAVKLYQELITYSPYRNIIFSPLCLTLSLVNVAGITGGQTKEEIANILGTDIEDDILYIAKEYSKSLRDGPVEVLSKMFIDTSMTESNIEAFKFESPEVGIKEFKDPQASRISINNWATEETKGEIQDLIPDGVLCESTVFVLTSGVSLRTHWSKPFFRVRTKEHNFEVTDDEFVKVQMMELEDDMLYGYSDTLEAELLQMNLNDEDLSILIVLPEQQLLELEARMDNLNVLDELDNLEETSVRVRLPKFIEESTRNFKELLQNELSYDVSSGPFSLFSRKIPFALTSIFQKTIIEVEEGPEPPELIDSSTLKEKPIEVFCDHPFLYLVLYKTAILLMGKFYQPNRILPRMKRKSWVKRYWQRVKVVNPVRNALPEVDKPNVEDI